MRLRLGRWLGHQTKPLPSNDEIKATAMLLGETALLCSCCLGRRYKKYVIGGHVRCGQCGGIGFDLLGKYTMEAFGIVDRPQGGYHVR